MHSDIARIQEQAQKIAALHAFSYAGDKFRYEVKVTVSIPNNYLGVPDEAKAEVTLSAACNAYITEKRAQEELDKVWTALSHWILCEEIKALRIKVRNHYVWRRGFTNMGQFCTEAFSRGVRLVGDKS